eukprot:TRINITY_DN6134_c0_g1_i10.p1 TRINITY_DN6134_c0_g1~~TRINITY_DN6134_c0_g1_i10.p1  ORF type:complete len:150 (+),score=30.09 TRINITY_DN6134_c0_g1_i10:293-742(+)
MKGREDFHIFSNQRVKVMPNKNKRACVTSYTLHDELLETTVDSKYLGVTITNNLTWSAHVEETAGKANRALSFLRSNINDRSLKVKAASYTTMVRPILEYASAAWDPHLQKDNNIVKVQRQAARFVHNSYTDGTPGCVENMLNTTVEHP